NGSTVTLNGPLTNAGALNVISGTLNLSGAITNTGQIYLAKPGQSATLSVQGGSVGLNGAGLLQISAGGTATVGGSGGTLNIGSQQLVAGAGTLGNNSLALINNGTIDAFGTGQTLTVNPSGGNFVNNGTMLAGDGPGSTLAIVNPFSIGTF